MCVYVCVHKLCAGMYVCVCVCGLERCLAYLKFYKNLNYHDLNYHYYHYFVQVKLSQILT